MSLYPTQEATVQRLLGQFNAGVVDMDHRDGDDTPFDAFETAPATLAEQMADSDDFYSQMPTGKRVIPLRTFILCLSASAFGACPFIAYFFL